MRTITPRHNVLGLVGAALAALMIFAAAAPAARHAADAHAHAARSCTPPKYPGVGYFTSLTVTSTSCGTGRNLVRAYYRCRIKHGVKGTCHTKVQGFSCSEQRNSIATEIDARVTCRKGRQRVVHTYQQDT